MNYIALLNRFWQLHRQQGFPPGATHMYTCLLNEFSEKGHKSDWPESCQWTDGAIAGLLCVNVKTVQPAREQLESRGLIKVKSFGQGSRAGRAYFLASEERLFPPTSPLTYPKNGDVSGDVNSTTSPKNGEVNRPLLQQHLQEHTQKTEMFSDKSYNNIEYQTGNNETQTIKKNKEGNDVLTIGEIQKSVNAEKNDPNRAADRPEFRPPPSPDDLPDADTAELEEFTLKLQNDHRIFKYVRSQNDLTDEETLRWIAQFVHLQWASYNLRDRRHRDLLYHCNNWIRGEIAQQKENQARNQRKNHGNNHSGKRTQGTLRPTSLGQPDYRGEGSTCDVDL
ncbi:hypothetical protein [Spirosoma terrae]|uniref:Uncharacterized protein n=1 Tax=Spirosoma terrae TaxID=1968276 RepID=A0A6L9L9D0_9BACT|nr:hypothetical protein [Spirosoma terrae]NDU97215.1 hypothetical protein [Spirosoma terrae]